MYHMIETMFPQVNDQTLTNHAPVLCNFDCFDPSWSCVRKLRPSLVFLFQAKLVDGIHLAEIWRPAFLSTVGEQISVGKRTSTWYVGHGELQASGFKAMVVGTKLVNVVDTIERIRAHDIHLAVGTTSHLRLRGERFEIQNGHGFEWA